MTIHRRDLLLTGTLAATAVAAGATTTVAQVDTSARPSAQADAGAAAYVAPSSEQKINVISLRDIERQAEKVLPPFGFHFIAGGSGDEWTLRENEAAFDRLVIEPNFLSGVKAPDPTTTILGAKLSMPVLASPMGMHGFAHSGKEAGTAKGTSAAGTLYVTPSVSNLSMEDIAAAVGGGARWFQIYFPEDPGYAREQLQRAKAAGYTAIVLTVDATSFGNRERAAKLGLKPPPHLGFGNMPKSPALAGQNPDLQKKDLTFDDVAFCQKESGLPVIVKGVLTPDLAAACVTHGCAGVWVSNHGGRQLDHSPATISVLPRIADAVGGKAPIIVDSGIRRGQDVFRAIGLGASVVGIGRPLLYGLALGGAQGVEAVFQRLRAELVMTMQLAGVASVDKITSRYVSATAKL
ncbi:alpha-hydroxy acid oxidase [Rhodoplanes roseus]|uniref:alpha-hydroxy acid oxidase n=1 Tax=Rhodoplanes roseus TaxID=29409 RepID=UPI00147312C0|nr:alpha-hydroxy acid oxidase [Rhodoplanes roseus]